MTDELNKIVAGLSDAQREKLMHIGSSDYGMPASFMRETKLGKRLIVVRSRYSHPFPKVWLTATSLGRQVRAHLQKEQTP